MIATLFKYKFMMIKNRFANMPAAEKLAYATAALVITGFVSIMTLMCVKKGEMISELINPATFQYFNYLSAVVLNAVLLAAISVEAFTEVEEIYYRRETQFILQFPNDFSRYFIYKLVEISLKIIPVLVLLFPLGLLYLFFFFKYYGAGVIINFALYSSLSLIIVMIFSSSLVMAMAAVSARLLSLFKQRKLLLIAALAVVIIFCFYFPALKEALSRKNENKNTLANIHNTIKGAAQKFDFLPAAMLSRGVNGFVEGEYRGLFANVFYSLTETMAAIVISFFINLIFLFRDAGSLLDKMSLRQNSSRSVAYFLPLAKMPAVWRGAIYDEFCHVIRRNVLLVFIVMIPVIFALPFYIPPKFFEAVRTSCKYWIIFALNSIVLMYGSELMAGDLINKRAFMQLLRPLSVKLKDFLTAKIVFYWLTWACLLLFMNSSWLYFIGVNAGEFLEIFFMIILWSAAAPLVSYGLGSLAYAKFSSKKDPDGLQPADPVIQVIVFIALMVMCVGAFRIYNTGFEIPAICLYFSIWLAASFFALSAGVKALEKKEL